MRLIRCCGGRSGAANCSGAAPSSATRGAGLVEGALEAAQRIGHDLTRPRAKGESSAAPVDAASLNPLSLSRFEAWVAVQHEFVFDDYRQRLNSALSAQQREQLTQRALLGAMEGMFERALVELDALRFNANGVEVERGRCSLTPLLRQPFRGLLQSAYDDVIAFNGASCALSNFPDEHRPSRDYKQVMLRDIAAAWQEFSLSANRRLIAKTGADVSRRSS